MAASNRPLNFVTASFAHLLHHLLLLMRDVAYFPNHSFEASTVIVLVLRCPIPAPCVSPVTCWERERLTVMPLGMAIARTSTSGNSVEMVFSRSLASSSWPPRRYCS
jgi:hypothetical protein